MNGLTQTSRKKRQCAPEIHFQGGAPFTPDERMEYKLLSSPNMTYSRANPDGSLTVLLVSRRVKRHYGISKDGINNLVNCEKRHRDKLLPSYYPIRQSYIYLEDFFDGVSECMGYMTTEEFLKRFKAEGHAWRKAVSEAKSDYCWVDAEFCVVEENS